MEHTCMQPLRRGDRRLRRPLHACLDGLVDLILHRGDRALARLVRCQPRALDLQGVTRDPFAFDRRLVTIAPVPVRADADMLEVTEALVVEKGRPPITMTLG